MWNLMVAPRGAIAFVARKHKHILLMSKVYGMLHRNAVGNAAIEHGHSVHHNNLADIRQRTRSPHHVNGTLTVVTFLKILRTTRKTVCCHHLECSRIVKEHVVIERNILIGEFVI